MSGLSVDSFHVVQILANDHLFCNHWKIFCNVLRFSNAMVFDLEKLAKQSSITEVTLKIMNNWISIASSDANLNNLSAKLQEIGCKKCAEDIAELAIKDNFGNLNIQTPQNNMPQNNRVPNPEISFKRMKDSITKHAGFICQNLRDIPSLLIFLRAKFLLTQNEITMIRALVGVEQVDEIFQIVLRQECKWEDLKYCLLETGNEHIVQKIQVDL